MIGYDELVAAGSMEARRAHGKIRVEGKDYVVREGDILHVRFAVQRARARSIAPAMADTYRIGEAAEILGVRVETLRRWERDGKLKTQRTSGGQRLVPRPRRSRAARRRSESGADRRGSARNRFPGVITEIKTRHAVGDRRDPGAARTASSRSSRARRSISSG